MPALAALPALAAIFAAGNGSADNLALGLASGVAGLPIPNPLCLARHCGLQAGACLLDQRCRQLANCVRGCSWEAPACFLNCQVKFAMQGNISKFMDFSACMFDNKCMAQGPQDGVCRVNATSGQANITTMKQLEGAWWVVRGVNKHYDNMPCQLNRYMFDPTRGVNGSWINNVSWLDQFEKPVPPQEGGIIIHSKPLATMPHPGYVLHYYPELSQTEPWVVVSKPHDDYFLMLWCGENPALRYAGGIVMSRRSKRYEDMPRWVEDAFRAEIRKHGLDYDADTRITDNSVCHDDPRPPPLASVYV